MKRMLHSTWYRNRQRAWDRRRAWLRRWGLAIYRTYSFAEWGVPDSLGLQRLQRDVCRAGVDTDKREWQVWPCP